MSNPSRYVEQLEGLALRIDRAMNVCEVAAKSAHADEDFPMAGTWETVREDLDEVASELSTVIEGIRRRPVLTEVPKPVADQGAES